jgi:hypothetical protein
MAGHHRMDKRLKLLLKVLTLFQRDQHDAIDSGNASELKLS